MLTKEEIKQRIVEKQNNPDEEITIENNNAPPQRKFILVTHDWSGLGFIMQEIYKNGSEVIAAYKPKNEKEMTPEEWKKYLMSGKGIFKSYHLDEIMKKRADYKDWYFMWDGNHNYKEHDKIKNEGFKVSSMGSEFCYNLENDREFGLKFAESCGLHSPDFKEFTSDNETIHFLQVNEDKAYVFKACGSEDSSLTQPFYHTPEPKNANLECQRFVKAIFKKLKDKKFILQERKKGIEVNVELFMSKGKPVLAHANLECKMMMNHDLGKSTGCAGDVSWKIDIDSPLVKMSVGKMISKLKEINYTGFADVNVIIADDEVWFLEFCFRTGYNAHPTFFTTIAKKTYLQSIADLIDDISIEAYGGFGGSVSLRCDANHQDMPIYIPLSLNNNIHLYDAYKNKDCEEGEYLMAGGGDEVGIITDRAYTVENALHNALDNAFKIKYAGIGFRTDLHKRDFPTSPASRYDALQCLKLI